LIFADVQKVSCMREGYVRKHTLVAENLTEVDTVTSSSAIAERPRLHGGLVFAKSGRPYSI